MFGPLARRLFRRSAPAAGAAAPTVDLSWFAVVEAAVTGESRRAAVLSCGELEHLLGVFHRGVRVAVDAERGSMVLEFPEEGAWRFAVDDVPSAEQIAAAARLGGLLVRLTSAGEGLVRVHGLWGRHSYVVRALPALEPIRP